MWQTNEKSKQALFNTLDILHIIDCKRQNYYRISMQTIIEECSFLFFFKLPCVSITLFLL